MKKYIFSFTVLIFAIISSAHCFAITFQPGTSLEEIQAERVALCVNNAKSFHGGIPCPNYVHKAPQAASPVFSVSISQQTGPATIGPDETRVENLENRVTNLENNFATLQVERDVDFVGSILFVALVLVFINRRK